VLASATTPKLEDRRWLGAVFADATSVLSWSSVGLDEGLEPPLLPLTPA
jgi:hypothetical protein